jgi:hypothetical protein
MRTARRTDIIPPRRRLRKMGSPWYMHNTAREYPPIPINICWPREIKPEYPANRFHMEARVIYRQISNKMLTM